MMILPGAVLFCCSENSIRSPMAEAMLKHLAGRRVYVDSAGVRAREIDGFAIAALKELGLDLTRHHAKTFGDLQDSYFDLIISLSPEAQHAAVEMTRTMACDLEFWPTLDPSLVEGTHEEKLAAYRRVRDQLLRRIEARFALKAD